MKKILFFLGVFNFLFLSSYSIFPQAAKKLKVGVRNVTKKSVQPTQTKNSDVNFEKRLAETMLESEQWKEYSFASENFRILFPRRSVKKIDSFYDEAVGKVSIKVYLSLGDDGVFGVGTFPLPYSITDENVLQNFYQEVAKEFLNDEEYEISEIKDINLNGKTGLEITSTHRKDKDDKAKMRVMLLGKNVFYNLASPVNPENSSPQEIIQNRAKFEQETTRFFNSFAELPIAKKIPAANVSPIFESTFADGIFHSGYFDLTIKIPNEWIEVAQMDVEGMRRHGKDVLTENSNIDVSTASNARRNLFTFASKPLGAEKNAAISCNLTKRPSNSATLLQLSNITEQEIRKVKIYTVTKATHSITLGSTKFVGFEVQGEVGGEEFQQMVYFTFRKDFALGFTMVYHNEEQRKLLFESLGSMKFTP